MNYFSSHRRVSFRVEPLRQLGRFSYLLSCLLVMGNCYLVCLSFKNKDSVFLFSSILRHQHHHHFFFRKQAFFNLLFSWREITIQCCIGFCHTAMQISHNFYRYPLPPQPSSPPPISHPSSSS